MSFELDEKLLEQIRQNINYRIRCLVIYAYKRDTERACLFINLKREKINEIVEKVIQSIQDEEKVELWLFAKNKRTYDETTKYLIGDDEYFKDALQSTIIIEYLEELGFPTIFTGSG
jgi:hypothetical protein